MTAGHRINALVLSGTSAERIRNDRVRVVEGDVTVPESLTPVMEGAEYCIHTAGNTSFYLMDREQQTAVNVQGVRNVVSAARRAGVRRLVHTSSVAAIGYRPDGEIADERAEWNWPSGLTYMETKRDGERIALGAAGEGFEVVSLNPATILGSGELNPSDAQLVVALKAGAMPAMPTGGMTVCDVEDVAAAHLSALERGRSGERYILGGPHVTHAELIRSLARAFGVSAPRFTWPAWFLPAAARALSGLERAGIRAPVPAGPVLLSNMHLYHSSDRAIRELGYRTRTLDEIVERTAA